MSLLLLSKHKALAVVSGRASIRQLIGDIRQKYRTPLHTLHKAPSRQQPCYSAAPGSASPKGAGSLQMQDLDEQAVELVRQIHSTNRKAVFYVAGGGVQVRSQCFRIDPHCLSAWSNLCNDAELLSVLIQWWGRSTLQFTCFAVLLRF